MFYMQYLSSLCQRRQWPEPSYEPYATRFGTKCVVRVNNREYHTEAAFENHVLASENAAMRAYLICRNFSVNDGMYPSGHSAAGTTQGLPVAIGRERGRVTYSDDWSGRVNSSPAWDDSSLIDGSQSGGSSPGSDRSHYAMYRTTASSSRANTNTNTRHSSGSGSGSSRRTSGRR